MLLCLAATKASAQEAEEEAPDARRDVPTIVTGGSVWAAAYLLSIGTAIGLWAEAGDDPMDLYRDLFGASLIPVAGPWVQLGVDVDDGRRVYWGILGGLQAAGLALVGIGHFVGQPDAPEVSLVPLPGGAALGARASF